MNDWGLQAAVGVLSLVASTLAFGDDHGLLAPTFEAIYARESQDNARDVLKAYERAAHDGSCKAARRLGDIYDKGLIGVPRDYSWSLKWYAAAKAGGCEVPPPYPSQRLSNPEMELIDARVAEAEGNSPKALATYVRAAQLGNCEASQRLAEIYAHGQLEVARDERQAAKWREDARLLRCEAGSPAAPK